MANKITAQILVTTFTNLNLLSSIDYKIKMHHWLEQAKRHIPGMTETDATIYFLTYKAMLEDVDSAAPNAVASGTFKEQPLSELQVDVRCFAIFIALQLFAQQAAANELATTI